MSDPEIPTKSLANLKVNLGTIATALGPLAIVAWQGMAWASEIEANIEANQKQIAELVELVKANDDDDQVRSIQTDRLIELLEQRIEPHPLRPTIIPSPTPTN